ncbi:AAA domain-containing protein [Nemorincola caseinilytica]|uniref:AAA domain-containing protein n=1 Tax=Nemorincola caseinilytica TaxID=2054315 RepID=A0ABP8NFG4_9BACT
MDHFRRLQELLRIEREADKEAYLALTRSSSAAQRRANGITWYPVAIRGTELSRAEYITVEVERTTHTDVAHQLRFGASAMLFSNHNAAEYHIEGTLTYVGGDRLKLQLRTDELPEWAHDGKLGIDLLFDDNSYDQMQAALRQALSTDERTPTGRHIRILTGQIAPTFNTSLPPYHHTRLNPSQQAAVNNILQAQELAIVHGPPGTGKTTTLVQAINALIAQGAPRILVTAPSNTAVDLLAEKLSGEGLSVLRVGSPARVSERLLSLTLDSKIAAHSSVKEMKRLKKQAAEFKDMAHKYKRSFGRAEREQRKALFDEAHKIMKDVGRMEQYIIDDIIARTQIVAATLVGANHYTVRDLHYPIVVIDEAGQAIEPACWIPILKGDKVILAGDHCQLPPTIKSDEAARAGLAHTLFERCIALYPQAVTLLQEQYRMHLHIMGYSARVFYEDRLKAHTSVAHHLLAPGEAPLTFIDTAGCGHDEQADDTSISNPEEAALLFKHLTRMLTGIAPHYTGTTMPSVAVISPYKAQLYVLEEQLQHATELQPYIRSISVNTIDSFQGQERDIVYISMTRSNTDANIGFLSDIRRMNVALTRARKKLVIIGDSATLAAHPFYAGLIAYTEAVGAYKSAWEENWSD